MLADNKPDIRRLKISPLDIAATPIENFDRGGDTILKGGKLEWRGGLVLTSAHRNFGGWSGLALEPDSKRYIAVSDSGSWMSGEITYRGKTPVAITSAHIGPLLTLEGVPLKRGRDRDAEAVAIESGTLDQGTILVSFEQNSRIARYEFARESGVSATKSFITLPARAKKMRRNSGLEAMTVLKAGAFSGSIVAFSERMRDLDRNHVGWLWSEGKAQPILLADIGDFDVVDVAGLADGGIVVLERRFRWLEGMNMRLRRASQNEIGAGRAITGEILLEADLRNEIDNMEGLAVSRGTDGETLLTVISDDNFNPFLQRTVLLQFALKAPQSEGGESETTAKARP